MNAVTAPAASANGSAARTAEARKVRRREPQQRIVVPMRELMPRLRQLAEQRKMTMAALMRLAVLPLLEAQPAEAAPDADHRGGDRAPGTEPLQVKVNFYGRDYDELTRRARACALSRGQYLSALMAGASPPPAPKDLTTLTEQLLASNDRIAALSVDLNAFMRLLGHAPAAELECYRARLHTLAAEVRAHLKLSAKALAEVEQVRRPKW